jgi:tetratricopeptide (TPR) repeat protein
VQRDEPAPRDLREQLLVHVRCGIHEDEYAEKRVFRHGTKITTRRNYCDAQLSRSGRGKGRSAVVKRFVTIAGMVAGLLVASSMHAQEAPAAHHGDVPDDTDSGFAIAERYHSLSMFAEAADAYVDFARRYPADKDAPSALMDAILFFIGLGRNEEAFEAAGLFEKNYGAKKIEDTATVVFSVGHVYVDAQDWKKARAHYESYLKRYTGARLLDELIQSHVFIGDGYRLQKKPDLGKALEHYREAAALFDGGALDRVTDPKRKASLLIASAKAKYELAVEKLRAFEAFETPRFEPKKRLPKDVRKWWAERQPTPRPFDIPPAVKKLLGVSDGVEAQYQHWTSTVVSPWLSEKINLLHEADGAFAKVTALHVPEWELAAAARAGDLQRAMAETIAAFPIPPVASGDETLSRLARNAMAEATEPYRSAAIAAYEYALHISTVVRLFSDDAIMSADRLRMLVPEKCPPMEESAPEIAPRELALDLAPGLIDEEPSKEPPTSEELALAAEREKVLRLVEGAPELLPLEEARPAKKGPSGSRR